MLLETTEYHGFPVIASIGSKHLVGFAMRTDLLRAISSARDKHIDLVSVHSGFGVKKEKSQT